MPDIGDFIRQSRRPAKIAIAAPGTPGDFRRSAYKIAKCVAGFSDSQFAWIGRLHVASLEAKIERICFSGLNTGLSE